MNNGYIYKFIIYACLKNKVISADMELVEYIINLVLATKTFYESNSGENSKEFYRINSLLEFESYEIFEEPKLCTNRLKLSQNIDSVYNDKAILLALLHEGSISHYEIFERCLDNEDIRRGLTELCKNA